MFTEGKLKTLHRPPQKCSAVNCRKRAEYTVSDRHIDSRWNKGYLKCGEHFEDLVNHIVKDDSEFKLFLRKVKFVD